MKVWLAVSGCSHSLWCPKTQHHVCLNWWVGHTVAVDKQTENRAQCLKIHHQCTEGKPGAIGAATGKGADEGREDTALQKVIILIRFQQAIEETDSV